MSGALHFLIYAAGIYLLVMVGMTALVAVFVIRAARGGF